MDSIKEEIRTDAPIPASIRYENGARYSAYAPGELERYVEKYPDVIAEVKDKDGNFLRYMDTSIIRRQLIEAGFLPLGTQSRRSPDAPAD